jgi:PAS domain-containing protein
MAGDGEQLYRILFQNMHYGFALCRALFRAGKPLPDFRILETNPAFSNYAFGEEEDLTGKNLREMFPELAAACRFALLSSGPSERPQQFRVHQTSLWHEFEVTVFPLDRQRAAIFLVDITDFLGGKKEMAVASENRHPDGRHLPGGGADPRTAETAPVDKMPEDSREELRRHKSDLESVNRKLLQANNAISVLARQIDRKRDELEKKIARRVSSQILPLVEELQHDPLPEACRAKLEVLSAYLRSLTPDVSKGGDIIISLSPMELRVAMMIKKGFSTDQTARMLHLSPETVKTHRRSIRRKLNIRNSPINLSTFLKFNLGSVHQAN